MINTVFQYVPIKCIFIDCLGCCYELRNEKLFTGDHSGIKSPEALIVNDLLYLGVPVWLVDQSRDQRFVKRNDQNAMLS